MTAVEIKLALAVLANSTEVGAMAKSPRKSMELVAIDKTSDTWTAEFRIEETAGEKGRYLNANGEVELKNKARTVKVEIYGEGVVAMPSQETAATETVETATPAVETTTADNTAPAAELKMPFNPLQNYTMFHNQIRGFLGTDCTVEKVDVAWHEARKYRVTTVVGVVYEVVLNGDFYVFTQAAEKVAMPAAAESQMTESEMSAFRDNLEKLSPKQLLVSLVEISAAKRHLESLSQGEAGESPFHKLAREVWITSDQMTLVDQYQKIGLPTRLINMPSESTEAAEIIPEVSTDETEVIPEIEVATTEAVTMPAAEAMLVVETVTDKVVETATPAVETTSAPATLARRMQILPNADFCEQVNLFLGCSCRVERLNEPYNDWPNIGWKYLITTNEGVVYRAVPDGDCYHFLVVALPETATTPTVGEMVFHDCIPSQGDKLSWSEGGNIIKHVVKVETSTETKASHAEEIVTDKVEMAKIVTHEEAVESFIADTGMADSPITRCRIWVMLSRAGLGDYRVSKRRPEQLLPCDLADQSEPETNVIIDPDGNEVWDAGWASWRERTMKFIDMIKAKQTVTINLNEVQVGIPGKGIARCAFAPSAKDEDREAVMMVLANGISLSDVIHHRRTKYKLVTDPRCFKGFGVVLAESYEGLKHRIPFIVRLGDEGWNEEALADFSKVVNL